MWVKLYPNERDSWTVDSWTRGLRTVSQLLPLALFSRLSWHQA